MEITQVENGYYVKQHGPREYLWIFENFEKLVEFMQEEFGEPDFSGGLKKA